MNAVPTRVTAVLKFLNGLHLSLQLDFNLNSIGFSKQQLDFD